jgi:hypothetical protein
MRNVHVGETFSCSYPSSSTGRHTTRANMIFDGLMKNGNGVVVRFFNPEKRKTEYRSFLFSRMSLIRPVKFVE